MSPPDPLTAFSLYDAGVTATVQLLGWITLAVAAAAAGLVIVTSIAERRWRAVWVATALALPLLTGFAGLLVVEPPLGTWMVATVVGLLVAGAGLLLAPLGGTSSLRVVAQRRRVDERDAVFHRFYRLRPGTPEFAAYYEQHPDKVELDAEVSAQPQLGHPGHPTYHALTSNFQTATTKVLDSITKEIDWPSSPIEGKKVEASPEELTRRVKGFVRFLGADLVGTTKLDPSHVYSHIGRSPGPWGDPIELDHPNAIAIAVEMSHDMVRHAPDIATTTETMLQYFEVAKIALIVARYINLLGYEARAHVDGNYRVMCVPIARDAGLGELGRLGLLITREYGPRVRLSVVTTDLPLCHDQPIHFGVQDFCALCKKCATNCPSDSVDAGDKGIYYGVEKWQTDRDGCYRFWRQRSSDCALCVRTCPYSHPGTMMHDVVRWAIGRNALARRIALRGDDLLYGRKPVERVSLPPWHDHP